MIQVSCGQQHTICRAVDRPTAKARRHINSIEKESPFDDDSIPHDTTSLLPGSTIGADVFVWGNGILGQLGMGLLGTSKGRRLPTLLASLVDQFPLGIIDVSAGSNFSAVVTSLGSVYSFGHSEYNQHGSGIRLKVSHGLQKVISCRYCTYGIFI